MTETEQRPFWAEEKPWQKAKLPVIEGSQTVGDIATAVPKFNHVDTPQLLGEYTTKDGLLLYHFYCRKRKEIFEAAETEMSRIKDAVRSPEQARIAQQEVAVKANAELAAYPWWPNFEDLLKRVFEAQFKYHPFKFNFYPETDSWSVAMPEPSAPAALTPERLEAPFHELDKLVTSQG